MAEQTYKVQTLDWTTGMDYWTGYMLYFIETNALAILGIFSIKGVLFQTC